MPIKRSSIRRKAPELQRWAAIWGVERVAAAKAEGAILVEGTVGTVVPALTAWRSGLDQDFQSTAEFTIPAGGVGNIDVEAVVAGAAGNAPVGVILSLVSPINGLVSQANVSTAIAGGADIETDASLRARLLARIQDPPRGGTSEDYEFWALSGHPDVTRAWARPLAGGLGTVTVYFMTDDAQDDGIPDAATVDTVGDYIEARRPVTADVTVAGPTAAPINFAIQNVRPMTQAVKDAVEAELQDLIRRETEPGGTLLVTHIREAISTSAGETDHVLLSPVANVVEQATEISTYGMTTFTDGEPERVWGACLRMVQTVGRDAYRDQLHALLPAGRAWPEEADSTLDALVRAMASRVADVDLSRREPAGGNSPEHHLRPAAGLGAGGGPAGPVFGAWLDYHGAARLAAGKACFQADAAPVGIYPDRASRSASRSRSMSTTRRAPMRLPGSTRRAASGGSSGGSPFRPRRT